MSTHAQLLRSYRDQKVITAKEHESLHLVEVKGLSYRTIALALGIGHSTVYDRVRRARQKINLREAA